MNNFRKDYPDFAAIEHHIRRAHAERAVVLGTWLGEAIAGALRAARGLLVRPTAPAARRGRLVVKASVAR